MLIEIVGKRGGVEIDVCEEARVAKAGFNAISVSDQLEVDVDVIVDPGMLDDVRRDLCDRRLERVPVGIWHIPRIFPERGEKDVDTLQALGLGAAAQAVDARFTLH